MRLLMAFNLAGITFGAAYCGFVWSPSHAPWLALIATILFFIAFAVPIMIELSGLSDGFEALETKTLEKTRREHYREGGQEILTNEPAPQYFFPGRPKGVIKLLILIGCLLMAWDVYTFADSRPAEPERGVISNF